MESVVMNSWLKQTVINWMVSRLREPSTWVGLAMQLTAVTHITLSPDVQSAITALGMSFGGFVAIVLREGSTK